MKNSGDLKTRFDWSTFQNKILKFRHFLNFRICDPQEAIIALFAKLRCLSKIKFGCFMTVMVVWIMVMIHYDYKRCASINAESWLLMTSKSTHRIDTDYAYLMMSNTKPVPTSIMSNIILVHTWTVFWIVQPHRKTLDYIYCDFCTSNQ